MKRETILAVSLGIFAGIVIALTIILYTRMQDQKKAENNLAQPEITPKVTLDTRAVQSLTIISPEARKIYKQNSIKIKGKAPDNALIIAQSAKDEGVVRVKKGSFSIKLTLVRGENRIRITMYDKADIDSRQLIVYYIEE